MTGSVAPFLSIIVPFHNSRDTSAPLLRILGSISPVDGVELILVDDGSTDNTPSLLRTFAERSQAPVQIIERDRGGPGAARNSGLDHAQGKFVWFVDSDDTIDLDAIALAKAADWPDVDLIAWEWEHPRIVRRLEPGLHSAHHKPAPTDVFDPIVCNWFSSDFLRRSGLRFPEHCFYEATPLESFVLPLLISECLKVDFVAYLANTATTSVTRTSDKFWPGHFDSLHTVSLGMTFADQAQVDHGARADFEAAFVRSFLWYRLRLSAVPGPSWIRAARVMRQYREEAERFHIGLDPLTLYPGRRASAIVVRQLWRLSRMLGSQRLYFEKMRRQVWRREIVWDPPQMPARWQGGAAASRSLPSEGG